MYFSLILTCLDIQITWSALRYSKRRRKNWPQNVWVVLWVGRGGGGHQPHRCWVKSISYYFWVIPSKINRIYEAGKCPLPSPSEFFRYAPGKNALGPFSRRFLKHLKRLLLLRINPGRENQCKLFLLIQNISLFMSALNSRAREAPHPSHSRILQARFEF